MSSSTPFKPPGPVRGAQCGCEDPSLNQIYSSKNWLDDLNKTGRRLNHQQLRPFSESATTCPSAAGSQVLGSWMGILGHAAIDSEIPGHAQAKQESQPLSGCTSNTTMPVANSTRSTGMSAPTAPNLAPGSSAPNASSAPIAPIQLIYSTTPMGTSAPTGPNPTVSIEPSLPTSPVSATDATTFTGNSAQIVLNPLIYSPVSYSMQSQAQMAAIPLSSRTTAIGGIPQFQSAAHHRIVSSGVDRCSAIHFEIRAYNSWRSLPAQQWPGLQVRRRFMRNVKDLYAQLWQIRSTGLPVRRLDWALSTPEIHDLYPAFGFWKQVSADSKLLVPVDPENWLFPCYRVRPEDIQGLATWSALIMSDSGARGIWSRILDECPYNPNEDLGQWRKQVLECLQRLVIEVAAESGWNADFEDQYLSSRFKSGSLVTDRKGRNGVAQYDDGETYDSGEEEAYREEGYSDEDRENESNVQDLEAIDDESQPAASRGVLINIKINPSQHAGEFEGSAAMREDGRESGSSVRKEYNTAVEYFGSEVTSSGNHLEAQSGDEYQEMVRVVAAAFYRGNMNRAAAYIDRGGLEQQTYGSLKTHPSSGPTKTLRTKISQPNSHKKGSEAGPLDPPPKKSKNHDKSTLPRARESSYEFSSCTPSPSIMRGHFGAPCKRERSSEIEDPGQRSSKRGKSNVGGWAQSTGKARDFSSEFNNSSRARLLAKVKSRRLASSATPSGVSQARIPTSSLQARTSTTPNSLSGIGSQIRLSAQALHRVPIVAAHNDDQVKFEGSSWCMKEGRALYSLVKTRRELEQAQNLNPMKDVKFWNLMSSQLGTQNITRSGSACKNFWGRTGRGYFDYEERINPKNPSQKVTSAQLSKKEKQAKKAEEAKQKAIQRESVKTKNEMQGHFLEDGEEGGECQEAHYDDSDEYYLYEE